MVDNIEKVLERGEKIELLVDKTDNLRFQVFDLCAAAPGIAIFTIPGLIRGRAGASVSIQIGLKPASGRSQLIASLDYALLKQACSMN